MNIHDPNIATPKVTTGPIVGSRKVYVQPEAAPDLRVPVREIALERELGRAAGSGLRHHRPLHRSRRDHRRRAGPAAPRIAWVKERGGVEEYEGRPIKPVDNGNVSGKHLARAFPQRARSRCARSTASR